jgi:hypothetical protein
MVEPWLSMVSDGNHGQPWLHFDRGYASTSAPPVFTLLHPHMWGYIHGATLYTQSHNGGNSVFENFKTHFGNPEIVLMNIHVCSWIYNYGLFVGIHHKLSGLSRVIALGRKRPQAITLLRPDNLWCIPPKQSIIVYSWTYMNPLNIIILLWNFNMFKDSWIKRYIHENKTLCKYLQFSLRDELFMKNH